MATIKANTSWSDRYGQAYFTRFEIIEELPEIGGKYADGIVDKIIDASIDKTSNHLHEEWSFHYIFVYKFGDDSEDQYNRYPVAVRKDWEAIEAPEDAEEIFRNLDDDTQVSVWNEIWGENDNFRFSPSDNPEYKWKVDESDDCEERFIYCDSFTDYEDHCNVESPTNLFGWMTEGWNTEDYKAFIMKYGEE